MKYKNSEYELTINEQYLRTSASKFPDREYDPEEGKCNNFNDRQNDGVPTWIMEHHTVANLQRSLDIFLKGAVSPHYMIDTDGTVYHMVLDANRAYHAGSGSIKYGSKYNNNSVPDDLLRGKGSGDMNSWSIGIENVNNAVSPFTAEQTLANIYLHEKLVTEHKMDSKNLLSHADWVPGRKIDPSPYYDWKALATASEKDCIEHNFGVYPTQAINKNNTDIIVSYKKQAEKGKIEDIQGRLEELGYSVLMPNQENLGLYDAKTQNAAFSFTIRYMNEMITSNNDLVALWETCCSNDKTDQTDARGILSSWTANHDNIIGDVLEQYESGL